MTSATLVFTFSPGISTNTRFPMSTVTFLHIHVCGYKYMYWAIIYTLHVYNCSTYSGFELWLLWLIGNLVAVIACTLKGTLYDWKFFFVQFAIKYIAYTCCIYFCWCVYTVLCHCGSSLAHRVTVDRTAEKYHSPRGNVQATRASYITDCDWLLVFCIPPNSKDIWEVESIHCWRVAIQFVMMTDWDCIQLQLTRHCMEQKVSLNHTNAFKNAVSSPLMHADVSSTGIPQGVLHLMCCMHEVLSYLKKKSAAEKLLLLQK